MVSNFLEGSCPDVTLRKDLQKVIHRLRRRLFVSMCVACSCQHRNFGSLHTKMPFQMTLGKESMYTVDKHLGIYVDSYEKLVCE